MDVHAASGTRGGATTGDQRRRRHREKAQEEEQAALRRVAVAVAAESRPEDIFQTVTEEVGRLLGADFASMVRFLPDANEGLIVGYWQQGEPIQDDTPLGRMITFSGDGPSEVARTTGRLTRYEQNRTLRPDWRERLCVRGELGPDRSGARLGSRVGHGNRDGQARLVAA